MGDDGQVGQIAIAGAGLGRTTGAWVQLDEGADLIGDVVDDRVGAVVDVRDTGQVDRHQWRDVIGLAGHHDARRQVDVELGELSGAEVCRNRNPQRRPSLGDPAARFKGEPEVIT